MSGGKRTINPTVVPGLPKVPSDLSPQAARYLEMLTEAVEIRLGRRGDPRDAAITFRDLIDAGLATEGPLVFNGSTGFSTSITPTGGPPNSSVPTAPTGFSANGAFFKNHPRLGLSIRSVFGYSITEVWRHTSDVLGDAQVMAYATGMVFLLMRLEKARRFTTGLGTSTITGWFGIQQQRGYVCRNSYRCKFYVWSC